MNRKRNINKKDLRLKKSPAMHFFSVNLRMNKKIEGIFSFLRIIAHAFIVSVKNPVVAGWKFSGLTNRSNEFFEIITKRSSLRICFTGKKFEIIKSKSNKKKLSIDELNAIGKGLKKKDPLIAAVTMIKDEEDIIYYNLSWHYRCGMRFFVIIENDSKDNTRSEIMRFKSDYPSAEVIIVDDKIKEYYQYEKMTLGCRLAFKLWNPEWVYPFDADEILCVDKGNLFDCLHSIDKNAYGIVLRLKDFRLSEHDDPEEKNPFKRMKCRTPDIVGNKMLLRWRDNFTLTQGNHELQITNRCFTKVFPKHKIRKGKYKLVIGKKFVDSLSVGMFIQHYTFRSKDHIRNKFINGGEAHMADPKIDTGVPWQISFERLQNIGEEYVDERYMEELNLKKVYDPWYEKKLNGECFENSSNQDIIKRPGPEGGQALIKPM